MSRPTPSSAGVARVGALLLVGAFVFGLGWCAAPSAPEAPPAEVAEEGAQETEWTCSMHPQIRQSEPGSCPICGMDLIPVGGDETGTLAEDEVALGPRAQALARIRTSEVRRLAGSGATLRLLGRVDHDETTLSTVTAWIGGRIERLHLRVTGERVRRGQVVATLYSPEVYAAQQDLITARRQVDRLASASELARTAAQASLEATRQRLRLLGIPDPELERMEQASAPSRQVAIRSPFSGTVLERIAAEGAYVVTGAPLYRLGDLTRLWVQLDAYESDLPHLAIGQTVELEVEAVPGEVFVGRVAFVDPVIDPRRRTARVRIEVSNPERRLRPGMFVEAVVRGDPAGDAAAQPLVIPASAPLFTGRRSVVYVEQPNAPRPIYEARVVRLGPRVGDRYPVVAGLSEGERVVTHGAFALDADLQIRGGRSMMTLGDDSTSGPYDQVIEVPEAFRAGLRPVLAAYLATTAHLADDDLSGARRSAAELLAALAAFTPTAPAPAVEAWRPLAQHLRVHAELASAAATIEAARAQLEPLSAQVAALLRTFGNPTDVALRVAHCPMAFDNRGAEWVQAEEQVDNPYFGSAMQTCGSVRASVEPGGYLGAPTRSSPGAGAATAGGHRH